MPGFRRNGRKHCDIWRKYSESQHFLLFVPEFSKRYYPKAQHYNLGNTFSPTGQLIAKANWTYTSIVQIFEAAREIMKYTTTTYSIYGHSAGAQFVHRLVLFLPEARIHTAICANAGWYTMPTYETPFPYGLKDSGITEEALKKAFTQKLIILLGTKDTNPHHKHLKRSSQARAQGRHRYERGKRFYDIAQREADRLHVPLNWELDVVRGVGHNNSKMVKKAVKKLWQGGKI